MMGLMGGGWERDSAMGIAERGLLPDGGLYRTGETRLQGRGKGVTWRGKRENREKRERRKYQEGRERRKERKKKKERKDKPSNYRPYGSSFPYISREGNNHLKFLASIVQPGKSFRSACRKMGAFSARPFSCQSSQRMTIWAKAPP